MAHARGCVLCAHMHTRAKARCERSWCCAVLRAVWLLCSCWGQIRRPYCELCREIMRHAQNRHTKRKHETMAAAELAGEGADDRDVAS